MLLMVKENAWDYLFFSFKANLPLEYRIEFNKFWKNVNKVIKKEFEGGVSK